MTEFNAAMGQFQQELVRWNRQINLVSRRDTLNQVATLIGQCRDSCRDLVASELADWPLAEPVSYFDLGSGGGLPGFVWHQLLGARYSALVTALVEPREKRAWFLERLKQLEPVAPLFVLNGRWGEVGQVAPSPLKNVLISLKALRLSDSEVLDGLAQCTSNRPFDRGGRLVIARFYPPEQKWNSRLGGELAPLRRPVVLGGNTYTPDEHKVLNPAAGSTLAASLVVSSYCVEACSE